MSDHETVLYGFYFIGVAALTFRRGTVGEWWFSWALLTLVLAAALH